MVMTSTDAARLRAPGPPGAAITCTKTVFGAVACRVDGDLDIESAPVISRALRDAVGQVQRPGELFVDLGSVSYFGAAGVTTLLRLREAAVAARVPLVLVAPSPMVRRVLEMTATCRLFTIVSRLQAVEAH
ncbi:STAS domain-containing protein [Streptacidiphilus rugosus]|uniref:STAS domain-containing protein n=1 Tax=Streptacidiphilus rugosus TaxID=405783 RepID=UPI000AFA898B|nr:STAS domain-containing protein [Streptacidiphilus rugosus]